MLLKIDVYYIPTTVSLAVIATILGVSIAASLRATRGQARRALQAPADPPFRVATEVETAALEPVWRRRRPAGEPPRVAR
jgi:tellurite resistance protein TerC